LDIPFPLEGLSEGSLAGLGEGGRGAGQAQASPFPMALLMNFGGPTLKDGIRRFIRD
jgi:hypothetical protein